MAKYSKGSQKKVEKAMHEMHEGKLKSGRSGKNVTNPRQAIAIGLSEAREEGKKGPKKRSSLPKSASFKTGSKKTGTKKSPSKSAAEKKTPPKKSKIWGASTSRSSARSSAPKKTVPKKETPKKLVYKRSVPKKIAKHQLKESQTLPLAMVSDLILQLKGEKVDALIMDDIVAEAYVENNDDLMIIEGAVLVSENSGFAVAVPKGDKELLVEINKTLARLESENKLQKFLEEAMELKNK